jgi:regulator of replication initiation timing
MPAPTMAKTAQSVEIDAIERLEDKVRKLVALVEEMRADRARLTAENRALGDEAGSLRKKLVDGEGAAAEVTALREERDQVRTRVRDMLAQIEALEL